MDKNGTLWQSVAPSWVLGCAQTDTNSQILPTVCSILARVRPEPIIARVGQPGPSEVFTFAEIHEDVIDDGSFAQADPGSATTTATL